MKVVAPYRPMAPYTSLHIELAAKGFDWIRALMMLGWSARLRAGAEVFAITDTELPVQHHRYPSREPLLMLWMLDVSLSYLESEDFDQDTVFVGPDSIVLKALDLFGGFDIALTARPAKFAQSAPLMNGLQFWPLASRDKLVWLHRRALEIAHTLSPELQRWGADTEPLIQLLGPIKEGSFVRNGLRVKIFPYPTLSTVGKTEMRKMRDGKTVTAGSAVVDFKALRKLHMQEFYERTFT